MQCWELQSAPCRYSRRQKNVTRKDSRSTVCKTDIRGQNSFILGFKERNGNEDVEATLGSEEVIGVTT